MNGRPLDDPLARMARWDQLRQRTEAAQRGQPRVDEATGTAIEDLVEALRQVAHRHESLQVTATAEDAGGTWRVNVRRIEGEVQVTVARVEARQPRYATGTPETAARLANLLRNNPTLLEDE
jgi:hypothetical protein